MKAKIERSLVSAANKAEVEQAVVYLQAVHDKYKNLVINDLVL